MIRTLVILCCAAWVLATGGCAPKRIINTERPLPPAPSAPDRVSEATPGNVVLGVRAAELAREQLGKPYQWGSSGPGKFDCSGLVFFVYGSLGVDLPRVVSDQATVGREVPRNHIQPGDLLFFALDSHRINHVGICVGSRKFIHAPRRYEPVRIDDLNDGYWSQRLIGARRIDPAHRNL